MKARSPRNTRSSSSARTFERIKEVRVVSVQSNETQTMSTNDAESTWEKELKESASAISILPVQYGRARRVYQLGSTSNPPLLLLWHSPDVWWGGVPLARKLSESFCVFYPDNLSDPDSVENSAHGSIAKDCEMIIDGLELGQSILLVAFGTACFFGTELARKRPSNFSGVVFLSGFHPSLLQISSDVSRSLAHSFSYVLDLLDPNFPTKSKQTEHELLFQFQDIPACPSLKQDFVNAFSNDNFQKSLQNEYLANTFAMEVPGTFDSNDAAKHSALGIPVQNIVPGKPKQVVGVVPISADVMALHLPCLVLNSWNKFDARCFDYTELSKVISRPSVITWNDGDKYTTVRRQSGRACADILEFWKHAVEPTLSLAKEDRPSRSEASDKEHLIAIYTKKIEEFRCPVLNNNRALRGSHPKGHGLLRGSLQINQDLDPELHVGLFAEGGKSFDVLIRYANLGSAPLQVFDDAVPDQRGMAIKVLENQGCTQDFLLNTMPVLVSQFGRDIVPQPMNERYMAALAPFMDQAVIDLPTEASYYSQTPFHFGPQKAVKFSVAPANCHGASITSMYPDTGPLSQKDSNYLRNRLADQVNRLQEPIKLEFRVQLQRDAMLDPIEDCRQVWGGEWVTVATITIPQQEIGANDSELAETISFSPWNCLPEHMPLGSVNRLRRDVYAAAAKKRHELNNTQCPYLPTVKSERVIVVGSGVAGLTAALTLSEAGYHVTVVEKASRFGGHAYSADCDGSLFDPGFGVFTQAVYPNFCRLLDQIGVKPSKVSAFRDSMCSFTRDGSCTWVDPLQSPFAVQIQADLARFDPSAIVRDPSYDNVSAGEYFAKHKYSDAFVRHYFLGSLVYIFAGHNVSYYLEMSIRELLSYYFLPGVLNGTEPVLRVEGGSSQYIDFFVSHLETRGVVFRSSTTCKVSERTANEVHVRLSSNSQCTYESYDRLVVATQANRVPEVLDESMHDSEHEVLSAFKYTRDTVIVHKDRSWMPKNEADWRYGNKMVDLGVKEFDFETPFLVTKMATCPKDGKTPVFGTYSYRHPVDIDGGVKVTFDHLKIDKSVRIHRARLGRLQGLHRTWFAGAYTRGLTLHEDAVVSGLEAANDILGCRATTPILQKAHGDAFMQAPAVQWTSEHTFRDITQHHAKHLSRKQAFVFAGPNGVEEDSITYEDLYYCSIAAATKLKSEHKLLPGDRALLAFLPGIDFIIAFLACQFADVVPVPVYPPDPSKLSEDVKKLQLIADDCTPKLTLTTPEFRQKLLLGQLWSPWSGVQLQKLTWIAINFRQVCTTNYAAVEAAVCRPPAQEIAFLQYSSGSTGNPKGVVITHKNMQHQMQIVSERFGFSRDEVAITWVPQYHDLGLISSLLTSVFLGSQTVFCSPLTFLKDPCIWGDLITKYRGTATAAPDFGYCYLMRKASEARTTQWDFSSLRVSLCAGEPVKPETAAKWADFTRPLGAASSSFCPSYGLAEHTVAVTMGGSRILHVDATLLETQGYVRPGKHAITSCGAAPQGVEVAVVDPTTCRLLTAGQVGEIWVDSPSKAAGYWGNEVLTREQFYAELAGSDPGSGHSFLRTGDLGFLHEGELFVTGRLKDLIIIHGRNIYPQDIERVANLPQFQLRAGAACAFQATEDGEEAICLAVELPQRLGSEQKYEEVAKSLRAMVSVELGFPLKVISFLPPKSVPKTTSGKLQRSKCRAAIASKAWHESRFGGAMRFLSKKSEGEGTEAVLRRLVLEVTCCNVDVNEPVDQQAQIDSVRAVQLLNRVNARLGVDLPLNSLHLHPTLAALARHIDGIRKDGAAGPQLPLALRTINCHDNIDEGASTTVLVHAVQGDLSPYMSAAHSWPGNLLGCQREPGRGYDTLEDMAAAYVQSVGESVPVEQEVWLGGFCMGGMVAREMAHQASTRGVLKVRGLILMDPPHSALTFEHMIDTYFCDFLSDGERSTLKSKLKTLQDFDGIAELLKEMGVCGASTGALLEFVSAWSDNMHLMEDYTARGLPDVQVPVLLVRVPGSDYDTRGLSNITVVEVDVDHFSMLDHEHAQQITDIVDAWMARLGDKNRGQAAGFSCGGGLMCQLPSEAL